MIKVRAATADEMVLVFLRGEIDSQMWRDHYSAALVRIRADRTTLIDRGDLSDARQNDDRRSVLGDVRGYGRDQYLFLRFPADTGWQLVTAAPNEVRNFKYMNREPWTRLSGGTRLVADGVKNLDQGQNGEIRGKVAGIATRLRGGEKFDPLIVAQHIGLDKAVLVEGHHRVTAYAWAELPSEIELFIGTSTHMDRWVFY
jgi:hypothetical protein